MPLSPEASAALNDIQVKLTAVQASLTATQTALTQAVKVLTTDPPVVVVPPVVVPPVVIPPVVIPPVTAPGASLRVSGQKLLLKSGAPVLLRAIELMYGPSAAGDPAKIVATQKALGANGTSPLFEGNIPDNTPYRTLITKAKSELLPLASVMPKNAYFFHALNESKKANLVCGFNFDHGGGRTTMLRPDVVAIINEFDHVFVENEVEMDSDKPPTQWQQDAIAYVKLCRDAGYKKQPIKVGSPAGGRQLAVPLALGKAVLDSDPEKNVVFTWQAYWGIKTSNWTYNTDNGFSYGRPGLVEACQAVKNSGLCFIVGLDYKDDIGDCGMDTLMVELAKHGIHYQYWALSNDGIGNNMLGDAGDIRTITTAGKQVQADFAKTSLPVVL
jgi:hypothetical protein